MTEAIGSESLVCVLPYCLKVGELLEGWVDLDQPADQSGNEVAADPLHCKLTVTSIEAGPGVGKFTAFMHIDDFSI